MYSHFYRRSFLIVTAALLGYALVRMLDPFWGALGWAAFLAFLLHPLHVWLMHKLRGRASASAGLIVGFTPFLVIAPLTVLGVIFASQLSPIYLVIRRWKSGRVEDYQPSKFFQLFQSSILNYLACLEQGPNDQPAHKRNAPRGLWLRLVVA
ncbi:MAG: hypothetical protein MN733_37405 [Nitrososphaera sp.]|nr:hypothetical protein [Nitrososphaera sp.]